MARLLWVSSLLALAGCVDDGGSGQREAETDGGQAAADGATSPDGELGEVPDAGAETDAAPEPDAAPLPDAAPPDMFVVPPGAEAGAPCLEDTDCRGGTCMSDSGWPDGYCTGDCDGSCLDGVCSGFGNFCGARCIDDSNCRDGYRCTTGFDGGNVCLPDPDSGNFDRVDGEACDEDAQCRGGTCLTDWPGGYCTTLNCRNRDDCAADDEDNRCLTTQRPPFCIRICQRPDDCRAGYLCQAVQQNLGICIPNPNQPFLPPDARDAHPLEIECREPSSGNQFRFDFEVAEDSTSYLFVPFSATGEVLSPRRIARPDGAIQLDRGPNAFQSANAALFGGINATLVPHHDGFADNLMSGAHTYIVDSNASEVCGYLLQEPTAGTTLDLNVYLVGVRGMSADTAADNANMQAVLARISETYAQADIALGEVRYYEPPPDVVAQFQIIRGQDEIGALLEHTQLPGDTRDDAVSLNVVFTREFAFANGQGVLGVSMGIPGPAGLHGSRTSGVVFTGEFMGGNLRDGAGNQVDGNIYTGNVLAHEVGHYLGLFHTSEVNGRGFDPLDDTPQCRDNFPNGCPDLENLMFPLARASAAELSPLQISTMRNNPLTKD